jgi:O-antigen/teichoic acid export membrane protein
MPGKGVIAGAVRRSEVHTLALTAVLICAATLFAFLSTRWLPAEDRGGVVVILTTASLIMLVGSLGVPTVGRRLVATAPGIQPSTYRRIARQMTAIHVVTTLTLGLGTIALTGGLSGLGAGVAFALFAPMAFFGYMCRELLHGVGRHRSAVMVEVVPAIGMLAWIVGAEVFADLTLGATLVAIVVGGVAQVVYVIVATRYLISEPAESVNWRSLLLESLPALGFSLGSAIVVRGDRLLLGAFAGPAAVGVYGLAATFSELLWVAPMTLGQFAFRRAAVSPAEVSDSRTWYMVLGVTAVLAIIIASVGDTLIGAVFGADYAEAVELLPVLCLAALPMASFYFDSSVLNGFGAFRTVSRITYVGVTIMIVACLAFVPWWGAFGAAAASALAYFSMGILARASVRGHRVPWVTVALRAAAPTRESDTHPTRGRRI